MGTKHSYLMVLAATSLLLVAAAWVDLHEAVTAPESSGSSGKCMMEHCGGLMMKCIMDASCRADFACSKSCVDMLPKDAGGDEPLRRGADLKRNAKDHLGRVRSGVAEHP